MRTTAVEPLFGLRCSAGGGGFPDYGRMRCADGALACRPPIVPGRVAWEYSMPELRALVAHRGELLALHGARVEAYSIDDSGLLSSRRVLRLRRAGHDLAAVDDALVVADGEGVSIYSLGNGTLLSQVEMCGRARRVFVDDGRAYVLGLLHLMVLDVTDPADPVVLQRVLLLPNVSGGLELRSSSGCGRIDRGADRVCDDTGACGAFGRAAAAFDRGRLFFSLLGTLYVLDVSEPEAPVVEAAVPVGLVKEMVAEGPFLYVNGVGRRTAVVAQQPDDGWAAAGMHDVEDWVDGVTEIGNFVIRSSRGRLSVVTRQ